VTTHPALEVLADAAEGLLDPATAAEVEAHLAGCPACRADQAELAAVPALLAAAPAPPMPAAVADRLAAVLAGEQAQRAGAGALQLVGSSRPTPARRRSRLPYGTRARPHPDLGRFGADLSKVSAGRRWGLPALAAAVAAVLVGFGGYVLSATLGLNEPPTVSVSTSPGQLGPQARQLLSTSDVDPHRFSQAWWCARRATDQRIVGLASTSSAGRPALLVYVHTPAGLGVTVVTGCDTADPTAAPWVPVPG
jgi:anti-sigma factor RsiW